MRKFSIFSVCLLLTTAVFADEGAQTPPSRIFKIEEMNCQLCAYLVNQEVRSIEGVVTTKASIKDRRLTVIAQPDVPNEAIVSAVNKLHYTAQPLTEK